MKTTILFLAALFSITFISCEKMNVIHGNHDEQAELREVGTFDKVESRGSFNVYVEQGNINEIEVQAESNLLPYIETYKSGNTLIIKKKFHRNLRNHYPINIYVKTTELEGLSLAGSGNIYADSIASNQMDISLSGRIESSKFPTQLLAEETQ